MNIVKLLSYEHVNWKCVERLKAKAWWQAHAQDNASLEEEWLFGKCHNLPLISLIFAIMKIIQFKLSLTCSLHPVSTHKIFALETPLQGFCEFVGLCMPCDRQFRIYLSVFGLCPRSQLNHSNPMWKSVHLKRLTTEWCLISACLLVKLAHTVCWSEQFTSCVPGSDQWEKMLQ